MTPCLNTAIGCVLERYELMKVNLGCGERWLSDWVNVDFHLRARLRFHPLLKLFVPLFSRLNLIDTTTKWPLHLIVHDIRKRLPFEDESVDYIYLSHVLEHLRKYEAQRVLRDCWRILKGRGIVRVVVPDLELLAEKYIEKDYDFYYQKFTFQKEDSDKLADRFLASFYPQRNKKEQSKLLDKIKAKFFPCHQWMYDFESLSTMLYDVGFSAVRRCSFQVGETPDIKQLDAHMAESLFVEATK